MRHRRSTPATLVVLAAVAALGAGLPLACGGAASVAAGAGSGGAGSSDHASSGHASTGGPASSTGSPAASSTGGPGAGGAPGTGGGPGAGGAPGTGGGPGAGGAHVSAGTGGVAATGTGGAPETTVTLHPNAQPLPGESACTVVEVSNIPEPDFVHLAICTPITYGNPPSGGDHWPIWAAYTQYATPVPREMYVHDLEHGAIVLTYNCAGPCPAVVSALQAVFASEVDPLCLSMGSGPIARMVLTPDPLLPTPIAASAWGATYTATCIDPPSLQAFVAAHYGHGREILCTDGWDPATIDCADGGADGGDGG
jgi:Protein of unknown function (DUF3105)